MTIEENKKNNEVMKLDNSVILNQSIDSLNTSMAKQFPL
jgi:hypothetical protein